MIVDGHPKGVLCPLDCIGVGAFSGKIKCAQPAQIVLGPFDALGILAFDRADRCWSRKKAFNVVFGDDPPECSCIRRTYGLTLKNDGGVTVYQRRIANVRMTHDPTNIRRSPKHFAGIDLINVLHRPVQRDEVPSRRAHHALWRSGRAGGIQNIGWVVAGHGHAISRWHTLLTVVPFNISLRQIAKPLFAL